MKTKKIILSMIIAFIILTFSSAVYAIDWYDDYTWTVNKETGKISTSANIDTQPGDFTLSLQNEKVENLSGDKRLCYIYALQKFLGSSAINGMADFTSNDMTAIQEKLEEVKKLEDLTEQEKEILGLAEQASETTENNVLENEADKIQIEQGKSQEEAKAEAEEKLEEAKEESEEARANIIYHNPQLSDATGSAEKSIDDMITDGDKFIKNVESVDSPISQAKIKNFSNTFYNILLALGVVVAVVMGMIMGIKFMMGSVEEKADIKTMLVPYIIGCIVVFAGFGIWKATVSILNETSEQTGANTETSGEETTQSGTTTDSEAGTGQTGSESTSSATDSTQTGTATATQKVTSISAKEKTVSLKLLDEAKKNSSYKLLTDLVVINPTNATDKTLTWTTSNSKVAILQNGKLVANGIGTATITATLKSNSKIKTTFKVTVGPAYEISSKTKPKSNSGDGYTQTITLGKRTFKLYKQGAGSYANKTYCSYSRNVKKTYASTGCGPTSVAIVLSGYGYKRNPEGVGSLLYKNSVPSSLSSMRKELQGIGRSVKVHTYSSNYSQVYEQMKNSLARGHQIVLYVGKDAPKSAWTNFTSTGYHFISILGINTSNDKVFVGNPSLPSGWFSLSTVVKARGYNHNKTMVGWIEIY